MSYTIVSATDPVQPRFLRLLSTLGVAMIAKGEEPTALTPQILWGDGVPAVAAPNGSIAIRRDGTNAAEVFYFRQGAAWVAGELDSGSGAIADAGGYYTTDTIDAAFDALALQIAGDDDATKAFTDANVLTNNDPLYTALDKLDQEHGNGRRLLRAFVTIPGGNGAGNVGDLSSTPVEIVAAPGAGFCLDPVSTHIWLDFEAAAYDVACDLDVNLGAGGPSVFTQVASAGFIDAVADAHQAQSPEVPRPLLDNTALFLEGSADPFGAAGDSPIKIEVLYRVRVFEPA